MSTQTYKQKVPQFGKPNEPHLSQANNVDFLHRVTQRGVSENHWEIPRQGPDHLRKGCEVELAGQREEQVRTISNHSRVVDLTKCVLMFRYLAPGDLTAYQFGFIIRKRIKLPEKDSLYFFVNGRYILKGGKSSAGTCSKYTDGVFNCRHVDVGSVPAKEGPRRLPLHHLHRRIYPRLNQSLKCIEPNGIL